jgi:hypothetical protein
MAREQGSSISSLSVSVSAVPTVIPDVGHLVPEQAPLPSIDLSGLLLGDLPPEADAPPTVPQNAEGPMVTLPEVATQAPANPVPPENPPAGAPAASHADATASEPAPLPSPPLTGEAALLFDEEYGSTSPHTDYDTSLADLLGSVLPGPLSDYGYVASIAGGQLPEPASPSAAADLGTIPPVAGLPDLPDPPELPPQALAANDVLPDSGPASASFVALLDSLPPAQLPTDTADGVVPIDGLPAGLAPPPDVSAPAGAVAAALEVVPPQDLPLDAPPAISLPDLSMLAAVSNELINQHAAF